MQKRFIELLADILEIPESSISLTDTFRELENWDSLSSLALSATIDEEYDLTIPRLEFDELISVGDICNYILSKK